KVVVLDNHSTSGCLNAERIACAVPPNDEDALHRPAAWRAKLASELGVALGEANDVVHLLRTKMTATAGEQEPAIVRGNLAVAQLELAQLLLSGRLATQRVRHRRDVLLNLL